MRRLFVFLFVLTTLASCIKKEEIRVPPEVIPDIINGVVSDFSVTPLNITTPDKGSFLISANNTIYKVDFNATDQAQSNATLFFKSDTILTDESREFASLGKDAVAYNPVKDNNVELRFKDGGRVSGSFDFNTSFGGVFGQQLIAQWRDPADPSKPNQKAKDDITNLVRRYSDKDGPGPEVTPVYLSATVSAR